MKNRLSFTNLGNTYLHKMRNRINHSEDRVDLENSFSQTVCSLLNDVFETEPIEIEDNDILFDPDSKINYSVSSKLREQVRFNDVWQNSDLPNVIGKFADSVYHRFLHLSKHPEKTNRKIRN